MMSPTKNPKPQNFFLLQTGRLAKSFEGLNNSLASPFLSWNPFPNECVCDKQKFGTSH